MFENSNDELNDSNISDERKKELQYLKLSELAQTLSSKYNSEDILDANSYVITILKKMLAIWESIDIICKKRKDVISASILTRAIADNCAILGLIYLLPNTHEEKMLRHYLFLLDGIDTMLEIIGDSENFKNNKNELIGKIEDLSHAKDIKTKLIEKNNWKYKSLSVPLNKINTKENKYQFIEMYNKLPISDFVKKTISSYFSAHVHGLDISNAVFSLSIKDFDTIVKFNNLFMEVTGITICNIFKDDINND